VVDTQAAAAQWRFHPIINARAHEEVVDQLTFAIRAGAFRPGERLPGVAELASALNVSKPTIGDALRVLQDGGVVRTRRGAQGGVEVVSDNVPITVMRLASGNRNVALSTLVEARRPIETELALLAGERGTESDFNTMADAIAEHRRLQREGHYAFQEWLHYDHLFHYGMGRAARSETLAYYQHQIMEQLAMLLAQYYEREEDRQWVIDTHTETLESIMSRDPDAIRAAMRRHLSNLEELAATGGLERQPD
jgi:DNA-binding FadR family transcriptional regulator